MSSVNQMFNFISTYFYPTTTEQDINGRTLFFAVINRNNKDCINILLNSPTTKMNYNYIYDDNPQITDQTTQDILNQLEKNTKNNIIMHLMYLRYITELSNSTQPKPEYTYLDIIKSLINTNKFDLKYVNNNKESIINLCVKYEDLELLNFIITKDEIIKDKSVNNLQTNHPIQVAVEKENHEMIELLLKFHYIDINIKLKNFNNLLQYATIKNLKSILVRIIEINKDQENKKNPSTIYVQKHK